MPRGNVLQFQKRRAATMEEALEHLCQYKLAEGRADLTVRDYCEHVSRFFRLYPEAWDEENLQPCLMKHLSRKMSPVTYNLDLNYLRVFIDWCIHEEGIFTTNPLHRFKHRKESARIVNIPIEKLKKLLAIPDRSTYTGTRDYAMFLLAFDTGIRPKEMLTLLPSDLNLKGLEVSIRSDNAKTRVPRTLPLSKVTADAIRFLLEHRPEEWKENVPVFCTWEGRPMKVRVWSAKMTTHYSKHLGMHVRPYDLRHTFALNFLRNGGNVFALQRIMGHTCLEMTRRYLALTEGDIREQHDKASPVNVLMPKRTRITKLK